MKTYLNGTTKEVAGMSVGAKGGSALYRGGTKIWPDAKKAKKVVLAYNWKYSNSKNHWEGDKFLYFANSTQKMLMKEASSDDSATLDKILDAEYFCVEIGGSKYADPKYYNAAKKYFPDVIRAKSLAVKVDNYVGMAIVGGNGSAAEVLWDDVVNVLEENNGSYCNLALEFNETQAAYLSDSMKGQVVKLYFKVPAGVYSVFFGIHGSAMIVSPYQVKNGGTKCNYSYFLYYNMYDHSGYLKDGLVCSYVPMLKGMRVKVMGIHGSEANKVNLTFYSFPTNWNGSRLTIVDNHKYNVGEKYGSVTLQGTVYSTNVSKKSKMATLPYWKKLDTAADGDFWRYGIGILIKWDRDNTSNNNYWFYCFVQFIYPSAVEGPVDLKVTSIEYY